MQRTESKTSRVAVRATALSTGRSDKPALPKCRDNSIEPVSDYQKGCCSWVKRVVQVETFAARGSPQTPFCRSVNFGEVSCYLRGSQVRFRVLVLPTIQFSGLPINAKSCASEGNLLAVHFPRARATRSEHSKIAVSNPRYSDQLSLSKHPLSETLVLPVCSADAYILACCFDHLVRRVLQEEVKR